MTALTLDDIKRAIELMEADSSEPPVYVAPAWIYDDPELLEEFTRIAMRSHPGEFVEVVRQKRLPSAP